MTQRIAAETLGFAFLLTMAMTSCQMQTQITQTTERTVERLEPPARKSKTLKEIDLTKIGHIAPKGRVQDKEYNQLEVVDQLLEHGKQSIPFLIDKLEDETSIEGTVKDHWSVVTVGDVALMILSNFSIDSTGKETIPGGSWDNFLQRGSNRDMSAVELLSKALEKHGRRGLHAKWQRIWTTWEEHITWDDNERCFYVHRDTN